MLSFIQLKRVHLAPLFGYLEIRLYCCGKSISEILKVTKTSKTRQKIAKHFVEWQTLLNLGTSASHARQYLVARPPMSFMATDLSTTFEQGIFSMCFDSLWLLFYLYCALASNYKVW